MSFHRIKIGPNFETWQRPSWPVEIFVVHAGGTKHVMLRVSSSFSRKHVRNALKASHEKVGASAPVFLAAVLEHVTTQVVIAACKLHHGNWSLYVKSANLKFPKHLCGAQREKLMLMFEFQENSTPNSNIFTCTKSNLKNLHSTIQVVVYCDVTIIENQLLVVTWTVQFHCDVTLAACAQSFINLIWAWLKMKNKKSNLYTQCNFIVTSH